MLRTLNPLLFSLATQAIASTALAEGQIETPAFWSCPSYSKNILAVFEHEDGYVYYSPLDRQPKPVRALGQNSFELEADLETASYVYLISQNEGRGGNTAWLLNTVTNGHVSSFECQNLSEEGRQIALISEWDSGEEVRQSVELEQSLETSERLREALKARLDATAARLGAADGTLQDMLNRALASEATEVTLQATIENLEGLLASVRLELGEASEKIEYHDFVISKICAAHPELSDFFVPLSLNNSLGEGAVCY